MWDIAGQSLDLLECLTDSDGIRRVDSLEMLEHAFDQCLRNPSNRARNVAEQSCALALVEEPEELRRLRVVIVVVAMVVPLLVVTRCDTN